MEIRSIQSCAIFKYWKAHVPSNGTSDLVTFHHYVSHRHRRPNCCLTVDGSGKDLRERKHKIKGHEI
jgi:hypothetical protein